MLNPNVKKECDPIVKEVNSTYMRPHRAQIVFDVLPHEGNRIKCKLNVLFAFASTYTFAE